MIRSMLFVAIGGAGGSLARYLVSNLIHAALPMRFPLATLSVNVVGSFMIGILYVLIAERGVLHADWRSVAMVGFLGAFTTFSTFSLETVALLENGYVSQALVNAAGSVLLCIGSVWLAMMFARAVVNG